MPFYCYMSGPYGRERYGPYATRDEQLDGFFRLLVSATVACDGDREVTRDNEDVWEDARIVTLAMQLAERNADDQPGAWNQAYKGRLYADDAFCRQERLRWMRQQQWEEPESDAQQLADALEGFADD